MGWPPAVQFMKRNDKRLEESDEIVVELPFNVSRSSLSEYKLSVVTYIGGFVAGKVAKSILCEKCSLAVYQSEDKKDDGNCALLTRKNRGGLVHASSDVLKICLTTERELTKLEQDGSFKREKNLAERVALKVMEEVLGSGK